MAIISEAGKAFLKDFKPTNLVDDPLPIKVYRGSKTIHEHLGQSLQWAFEYLNQRNCPHDLLELILPVVCEETRINVSQQLSGSNEFELGAITTNDTPTEPLALMHSVITIVDKILEKLTHVENEAELGQQFHQLAVKDEVDHLNSQASSQHIHQVSYFTFKNQRRSNEDRLAVYPSLRKVFNLEKDLSYFAVFDGHHGAEAAEYGAAQLLQLYISALKDAVQEKDAILEAFKQTDALFCLKCRHENISSGSTVVAAFLCKEKLYLAYAGDSLAALFHNNEIQNLVVAHKPERKDETLRIQSKGGEVMCMNGVSRVNGNLAVSRSIGDHEYKEFVISEPDIVEIDLKELSCEYLILASDGLWDTMGSKSIRKFVDQCIIEGKLTEAARLLAFEAKGLGSADNISVIIVYLQAKEVLQSLASNRPIETKSSEEIFELLDSKTTESQVLQSLANNRPIEIESSEEIFELLDSKTTESQALQSLASNRPIEIESSEEIFEPLESKTTESQVLQSLASNRPVETKSSEEIFEPLESKTTESQVLQSLDNNRPVESDSPKEIFELLDFKTTESQVLQSLDNNRPVESESPEEICKPLESITTETQVLQSLDNNRPVETESSEEILQPSDSKTKDPRKSPAAKVAEKSKTSPYLSGTKPLPPKTMGVAKKPASPKIQVLKPKEVATGVTSKLPPQKVAVGKKLAPTGVSANKVGEKIALKPTSSGLTAAKSRSVPTTVVLASAAKSSTSIAPKARALPKDVTAPTTKPPSKTNGNVDSKADTKTGTITKTGTAVTKTIPSVRITTAKVPISRTPMTTSTLSRPVTSTTSRTMSTASRTMSSTASRHVTSTASRSVTSTSVSRSVTSKASTRPVTISTSSRPLTAPTTRSLPTSTKPKVKPIPKPATSAKIAPKASPVKKVTGTLKKTEEASNVQGQADAIGGQADAIVNGGVHKDVNIESQKVYGEGTSSDQISHMNGDINGVKEDN